jgi:hypothetical protein
MMRRTTIIPFALLLLAGAGGCLPAAPHEGPGPEGPLVASLSVLTGGSDLQLTLRVTNASEQPVALTFPSAQTHDFVVRQRGAELWRWSADRMFAAVITSRLLAPGETAEFIERWAPPGGVTGEIEVEASVVSADHPLRRSASIRLP